ncbi:hypothetical protein NEF87_002770 [Candidatus Lokiarchaeum ossiferum]|uniref:Uncharacterized protein n=1 Tax=Candidatus Lokiarchaeum ossiferum TaxID=2951803 RepID=A0ABY6HSJ3_9ARCH|nr:hypothetical protein NEF87_002770 [Candidatus Lokiarchaeum sp. B-35]
MGKNALFDALHTYWKTESKKYNGNVQSRQSFEDYQKETFSRILGVNMLQENIFTSDGVNLAWEKRSSKELMEYQYRYQPIQIKKGPNVKIWQDQLTFSGERGTHTHPLLGLNKIPEIIQNGAFDRIPDHYMKKIQNFLTPKLLAAEKQKLIKLISELFGELMPGDEIPLVQAEKIIRQEFSFNTLTSKDILGFLKEIGTKLNGFQYIRLKESIRYSKEILPLSANLAQLDNLFIEWDQAIQTNNHNKKKK